ncbi:hypothetical protein EKK97_06535 [Billgrantia tianxiuensis]|uniref:Uncharacterized protein n=1 Tax=Billgrantia tianxiuensis TaxID=2497861 RepID=A0A6I6SFS8_9GAMM|nr:MULTISPECIES: hypothetical protein [Halomonas]MCE8032763.1 hypothetical protein [Halomonas sp. MCCC 1A11057]QHC49339.1 hypothetical protein EKK97_06535 [Halomonas tianxiuensis]
MRFINLFPHILTICAIFAPVFATYSLWMKGPVPEKSLEYSNFGTSDVLSRLNKLESGFAFSLNYGEEELRNLYSVSSLLINSGKSPILPSDFYKGISVSVDERWKFLSVETTSVGIGNVELDWARVSDTVYKTEPTLINPKDAIIVTAYLTYADDELNAGIESSPEIELNFSARIANLREIKKRELEGGSFDVSGPPILVSIAGWGIVLFLSLFSVFFLLQIWLVGRAGFFSMNKVKSTAIVFSCSILSIATAEVVTYYMVPGPFSFFTLESFAITALNFSILIAQSLLMGGLFWKGRKSKLLNS